MAPKRLPDQAYLRECVDYDPVSGSLRWRVRPISHFPDKRVWKSWNSKQAGKSAQVRADGRSFCRINNVCFKAHRIIWKIMTDQEPPEIDHKDGDGFNNRWNNLREADRSENNANRGGRKAHKHPKGVSPAKGTKWQAHIVFRGVRRYLGVFNTAEAAHAAYCEAAIELHKEFANFGPIGHA